MAINQKFLSEMKAKTSEVITKINLYNISNKKHLLAQPTSVMLEIGKYGAEHIFEVIGRYHGGSSDDDCDFIYWNDVTGEFFKDTWSTRWASPPFSTFEWTELMIGLRNDAIDKNKMLVALKKENERVFTSNPTYDIKNIIDGHFKVTVNKGRKWRGTGYLIGIVSKTFQWDTPRWTSRYYGDNGYGRTTTIYAKIYDPEKNRIEFVNIHYVILDDIDKMINEYKTWRKSIFDNLTVDDILFTAGQMPIFNVSNIPSFEEWLLKNHSNSIDYSTAVDSEAEKQKEKNNEFKVKKMEQLIEWVKNNTDKKGDEITKLAEKIFNKKYGNND